MLRVPRSIWFAMLLLTPSFTAADTVCSYGAAERSVRVEAPPGQSTPCAVRYRKTPEGRDDVLWRAQVDRAYCEDKARGLVALLRGAGWDCAPAVSAPPPLTLEPSPTPERAAAPVARIETPPAEDAPPTLRDRLVRDARLRFYRNSYGESALRDALRIFPIDLNGDGSTELFLQVALPELCSDSSCTWDLYQLAPDGSLATLGVRGVLEWRALSDRRNGYPDLAVRFAPDAEAEFGAFRFELGMYRPLEPSADSGVGPLGAARSVAAEERSLLPDGLDASP